MWEQLGEQVPDNVVVPVGHGTMLLGMYKGFEYLARAGVTHRLPRVFAVQTAACAPLYQMFHQHLDFVPAIKPEPTVAEGIAISTPLRRKSILQAVAETGGTFVTVSERAIKDSMVRWARRGILMEPTAATATAGFEQLAARQIIELGETTAHSFM